MGQLPVILMEMDDNGNILKTYVHADGEVLMQHDGDMESGAKYFYLHDRLGSVRQVIDSSGNVKNRYTYEPFGKCLEAETEEIITNPFQFTGQFYDSEIEQYHLRARQYDPCLFRFTSRDPARGEFSEPMTRHMYLYCSNDPVNYVDPTGEIAANILSGALEGVATYTIGVNLMMAAIDYQGENNALSEFLWTAGDLAVWATPIAILHGLANPISLGKMRTVTHWPSPSGYQGWVQLGRKNWLSYSFSGMIGRGQPGSAYYRAGTEFLVEASRLKWPAGRQFFKGLVGQRILMP